MSRPNNAWVTTVFAKNLSQVLDALRMSQNTLSQKTGLTPACISQILNGKREPTLSTVVKILAVIPVEFERLMLK